SPAEKAGLKAGDVITDVNGVSTSMVNYTGLREVLDNPDKKPVNLRVMRDGQPRDITVTPEEMTVPAVSDTLLPGDIAYIKVEDFMQRDTVDEMRAAIEKYPQAKGFVIDVRDNTGGLFDQGITSASLFVDKGRLLSISTRVASDPAHPEYASTVYNLQGDKISVETGQGFFGNETTTMPRFPDLVNKPTVILVNGMTASAGEIFASSVQENGDAKVVGTQTYGKGIGQTVIGGMPNGSKLRVTSFRYYSPQGHWFGNAHDQRIGVKPDFEVDNPDSALRLSGRDAQLARGLAVLNQEIAQRQPNR
ncbi:MAG: PDZ domain-containing protein, partial [Cyanobacteria bacterium HKST-UBA02]|nr:PDZ domain-containing protein [Cyanobacteria bacterium HKST-UBA02]